MWEKNEKGLKNYQKVGRQVFNETWQVIDSMM